ncbi:aldo/keto reductase [Nocardia sp. 348MFTsu5.1]|uniref:aldo/keto reductase n=1 Tax=Nocardia sp. 348MFTsu5.1 TaxID=1172185 RepID=UPI00037464F4|nr:aldo/keto reductase [Nocardia sp. 348MFTsu5.1]
MTQVPNITLNNGNTIPQLGFGVFQINPADTAAAVRSALEVGYRHFDTAEMYGNEKEVGEGIRESGVPRDEIFVTSKLNNTFHEPDAAREAFATTLSDLGLDHIDLFLIHWPLPTRYGGDFVSTWETLIDFAKDGRASAVGVSNFTEDHLERLAAETSLVPAVNQVEIHPYFANNSLRKYNSDHGIVTQAWSPIAQGDVLGEPAIAGIAARVGKSPAQVVLRWHIQRGDVIFPKSVTPKRVQENFAIFDFELDNDAMSAIDALDKGEAGRRSPHPDVFDWVG